MEEAIRAFQLNTGLAQTGIADEATRKRMAQPRCSFPDGVAALDRSNKWDLSNHGSWGKSNLTWKLVNTDGDLSVTAVRNLIQGALSQWSVPSAYSFTEVTGTGSADILITFEAFTANGHPDPDGLASTAFISGGGDVKLNSLRDWSQSTPPPAGKIDLLAVLLHELGHAIGLAHSSFTSASMFAAYDPNVPPKRVLSQDDQVSALAMNIGWSLFDDFSDVELAYNQNRGGTNLWALAGSPVPGGRPIWELKNGSTWVLHPGAAVHISVNSTSDENRPWVVNDAGQVFRFNPANDNWDPAPGTVCATDIGVGSDDSVWIIGCTSVPGGKNIMRFSGSFNCTGMCFTPSPGTGAVRIAVGPKRPGEVNVPWVINNATQILRKASPFPLTSDWNLLPGFAKDIAADAGYAWSIGTQALPGGFNIQAWDEQPAGTIGDPLPVAQLKWVTVPGAAVNIAQAGVYPLVVNDAGQAFWAF
jgi:hypothetical protein